MIPAIRSAIATTFMAAALAPIPVLGPLVGGIVAGATTKVAAITTAKVVAVAGTVLGGIGMFLARARLEADDLRWEPTPRHYNPMDPCNQCMNNCDTADNALWKICCYALCTFGPCRD